jgi:hypothetical protein
MNRRGNFPRDKLLTTNASSVSHNSLLKKNLSINAIKTNMQENGMEGSGFIPIEKLKLKNVL